jgi:beta-N-acetylhexosaminidase
MKHNSTKVIIVILLIGAILSGYNYFKRPFLSRFTQLEQQVEPELAIDPLEAALAALSTSQKIAQVIALPIDLDEATQAAEINLAWLTANQPGFVTIFGGNLTMAETTAVTSRLADLANPHQVLVAVDHEGGVVQRLRGAGFTSLPAWRQSCQLDSSERQELFLQSAGELNQAGVQIVFAPVLDIAQPGSFLGNRACTTNEETVATASDFVTSFAQYGILSVVKHFPGIGSLTTDPHNQLDTVSLSPVDTLVFDQVLNSFPNLGVMTAHVAVENRTEGVPCSLSVFCLDRFPINFPQVLLFSDGLEMESAGLEIDSGESKSLSDRASAALMAGNDVLVFGRTVTADELTAVIEVLAERYESDELFSNRVNQAVVKILPLKMVQEVPQEAP